MKRLIWILVVFSLWLFTATSPFCRAESDDERLLDGLRRRRLFDLASSYCKDRLQSDSLSNVERISLTIELVRTQASRAVNLPPTERESAWKQSHDVCDQFLARHAGHPRVVLIRVQDALTHLARGQLLRQEMEAGAGGPKARDLALTAIRSAASQLAEVDKYLTREIPLRNRTDPKTDELSAEELLTLQNNVRFQLARAYRNRAACYEKGSDDRIDALTRVLEQHKTLLAKLAENDPLRWEIYIDGIRCYRLLANYATARQSLVVLQSKEAPAAVQLAARAEEVRLKIAQGKLRDAFAVLQRGRKMSGQLSAELDFAHVETYNALAQDTNDKDEMAKWQKAAVAMMKLIEQTHGPYWGRRANLLLVRSVTSGRVPQDLTILIGIADEAFRQKQFDQAVKAYDDAASRAAELGDAKQAFINGYRAAFVQQQRNNNSNAAKRMRDLALTMKTYHDASSAHLMAIWNASVVVRKDEKQIDLYTALLEEHISTWPDQKTANQARMWLALLRERQQQWLEATGIYLEVSATSEHFASAVKSASTCAITHFQQLKSAGHDFRDAAEVTATRFNGLMLDDEGKLPSEWSLAQQTAAVTMARLWLQFANRGHAEVSQVLKAALAGSPSADATWKTTARSLMVVALARQTGRGAEAGAMLAKLADGSPEDLLIMLWNLDRIGRATPAKSRVELAKLSLQATNLLLTKQLSDAKMTQVQRIRAEAFVAAGQRTNALALYESLAKTYSTNGPIQVGYGQLLLDGDDDKESQERALVQWRKIDRASRPRSDRWWKAKYSIALAQYNLSRYYKTRNPEQATLLKNRVEQLLQYLKAMPPGWENSALKAKFEQLLKSCEG